MTTTKQDPAILEREHRALLEWLLLETGRTVNPKDTQVGWSNVSMERVERIRKAAKQMLRRHRALHD